MSTAINLLDRNSESRKVLWAVLAAFFIHLLVAFSLATFSGRLSHRCPKSRRNRPSSRSSMLCQRRRRSRRMRDSWRPRSRKNPPKLRRKKHSNRTRILSQRVNFRQTGTAFCHRRKEKTAHSRISKRRLPPSVWKGNRRNQHLLLLQFLLRSLADATFHSHSAALDAHSALPPPATPPPDQLAMLMATPPPAITPSEELAASPTPESAIPTPTPQATEQPASSYRPYLEQTRVSGSITIAAHPRQRGRNTIGPLSEN